VNQLDDFVVDVVVVFDPINSVHAHAKVTQNGFNSSVENEVNIFFAEGASYKTR
jgi:hypothetical protein